MMAELMVDSNVLLDVMTEDPAWFGWSTRTLEECGQGHILVINPIIYAEVSVGFDRIEDLDAALPPGMLQCRPLPLAAAFLAGKCFLTYRRRGGERHSTLPGFFIGAHAAVENMTLITRDASRYRTYFPKVKLITPE